ncbi:hypothetical protein DFJ73DRAFT_818949 [Zopfochytrium polystomum]|nr:hypothetical protein DFJ73DRAFT_818949 [Zopfochytrium polystomum]
MEGYRRAVDGSSSSSLGTAGNADPAAPIAPPLAERNNENVVVVGASRAQDYVARATALLDRSPAHMVILTAKGRFINKLVSVAEILKRDATKKEQKSALVQENRIFREDAVDRWDPVASGLDSIQVTRSLPCMSIHLRRPQSQSQQ